MEAFLKNATREQAAQLEHELFSKREGFPRELKCRKLEWDVEQAFHAFESFINDDDGTHVGYGMMHEYIVDDPEFRRRVLKLAWLVRKLADATEELHCIIDRN